MSPASTSLSTSYSYLRSLMLENTGIDLGTDKQYLMETRLSPIISREGLKDMQDLCRKIMEPSGRPLLQDVISSLLTHETSFFRDSGVFQELRDSILPDLSRRVYGRRLRIWSAAASSGQEIYSLAIMIAEMGLAPFPELLATDVCPQVLATAEAGQYTEHEVTRGLRDDQRKNFFQQRGRQWIASPKIRGMVRFEVQDLRSSMEWLGRFDVILCRNVLIYFDAKSRWSILQNLRDRLGPEGVLILGGSESILEDLPGLQRESSTSTTLYRRNC